MGWIEIRYADSVVSRPLIGNTVIGRGHECTWRLAPPMLEDAPLAIPSQWLEIRWCPQRAVWEYTVLRGAADHFSIVQRALSSANTLQQGHRLEGGGVCIEMLTASAPEAVLIDVKAQEVAYDVADALLEQVGEHVQRTDTGEQVKNGQMFVHGGCAYRYFAGDALPKTVRSEVDVSERTWFVELDLQHAAGPTVRYRDRTFTNDAVIMLDIYREALNDADSGGYLTAVQVRKQLSRRLGGKSSDYRGNYLSEMRRSLLAGLSSLGMQNVRALFDVVPAGEKTRMRLMADPNQFRAST